MSDSKAQKSHLFKLFISQLHPNSPSYSINAPNSPTSPPPKLNFKEEIERRYRKSELKRYVFPRKCEEGERSSDNSTSSTEELREIEAYNLYRQNKEKRKVENLMGKLGRNRENGEKRKEFMKKVIANRSEIQNKLKIQTSIYQTKPTCKIIPPKRFLQKNSPDSIFSLIEKGTTTSRLFPKKEITSYTPKSPSSSITSTFYLESTTKKRIPSRQHREDSQSKSRLNDTIGKQEKDRNKRQEDNERQQISGESQSYSLKLQELMKKKKEEEKKALTERIENKSLYLKMQENLLRKLREVPVKNEKKEKKIDIARGRGKGGWSNNPSFNSSGNSYSNSLRLLNNIGMS